MGKLEEGEVVRLYSWAGWVSSWSFGWSSCSHFTGGGRSAVSISDPFGWADGWLTSIASSVGTFRDEFL